MVAHIETGVDHAFCGLYYKNLKKTSGYKLAGTKTGGEGRNRTTGLDESVVLVTKREAVFWNKNETRGALGP